jgi:putative transferase (TIGR04331 family)
VIHEYLNKINDTSYGLDFWRVLLGPWLLQITMSVFIKEKIVREAFDKYKIKSVSSIHSENKYLKYDTDEEYATKYRFDELWNFSQYSVILKNFKEKYPDIVYVDVDVEEFEDRDELNVFFKKSILQKINYYVNIAVLKFKLNSTIFYGSYFSRLDLIKLQLKLGYFPLLLNKHTYVTRNKKTSRTGLDDVHITDSDNSIRRKSLSKIMKQVIPVYAFEDFNVLRKYIYEASYLTLKPKIIFTSTALWFDTFFKAYVAFICQDKELNVILLQMQHCGSAGITKCNLMDYEEQFGDYYLTWGHKSKNSPHEVSFGIPKKTNLIKRIGCSNHGDVVVVRSWNPHHAQKLSIEIDSDEIYFNDTLSFVKGLNEPIINYHLLIRLYPAQTAFGTGFKCINEEEGFWKGNYSNIRTDNSTDITQLYGTARVVVYTYLQGTGYIECLANNIPLIIIARNYDEIFNEDFSYFSEKFKNLKILFDSPLKASEHINKIFNNTDSWWLQKELQKTIKEFNDRYILKPKNRTKFFKETIIELHNKKQVSYYE